MNILPVVILGVLFFSSTDEPAATDVPEADASEIDPMDQPQDPLVFRWYDAKGMAHDTSDASVIPPGSKFEVKGGLLKKGNLERRRSWWRARQSRLQAELRGAQDELNRVDAEYRRSVEQNEPGTRQAALATKVETWKSIVASRQREIRDLKARAAKAKIPPRWLKN